MCGWRNRILTYKDRFYQGRAFSYENIKDFIDFQFVLIRLMYSAGEVVQVGTKNPQSGQ